MTIQQSWVTVRVCRCPGCGTIWSTHCEARPVSADDPWTESVLCLSCKIKSPPDRRAGHV